MKRARLKDFGKGGGNYFASPKTHMDFIPSGCKLLDLALGGGWAERRVANVVGDKSTGKTLLMIEAAANFSLKYGKRGNIRYRESEAAFDKPYAEALGMPVGKIDFGTDQLITVEDMFEDLMLVIEGSRGPELYIIDSLDALSSRDEMARDLDEGTYGTEKAKKMSQILRRTVRAMERKQVTCLIVSQVRSKIGVSFGRNTTRTGGRALDFYASQVAYLNHKGTMKKKVRGQDRVIGIDVAARLDKNKVGLPFRVAEFPILFGFGIDDASACLEWLRSTKRLKELDLKDSDLKGYKAELEEMPDEDYREEVAEIHRAVTKCWYEIEKGLMPTRRKYG